MTATIKEEDDLPNHTLHMRRALLYCVRMKKDAMEKLKSFIHEQVVVHHPGTVDELVHTQQMISSDKIMVSRVDTIAHVHVDAMSPADFRKKFHRGNLPCLIRGLDCREFDVITALWRTWNDVDHDDDVSTNYGSINKEWFLENVGETTPVPIRKETSGGIDIDGRAEECEVLDLTMKQWIDLKPAPRNVYLKDWHLIQQLAGSTLYDVPEFFQHDLLNRFLLRFTDGDYRFVYWGPAGSQTPIHSDVLNSFSWSYNIVGHKKWTFYPPIVGSIPIVVEQHAGECIFVPSGWKHEVQNIVETLSINHNWVTSANVAKMLDCVMAETKAVRAECREWNVEGHDALESMLRGCVGLDITSSFFLLLSSLLDCILVPREFEFDLPAISNALKRVINDVELDIRLRLEAVLASKELSKEALAIATDLLHAIDEIYAS